MDTIVFSNLSIIDGSGAKPFAGEVRVQGNRIAAGARDGATLPRDDVRLYHQNRETFTVICDGPEEFRRTARTFVREGVDTLKFNPSGDEFVPHSRAEQTVMTEAEIDAVCEVGHAHGKRLAAHARSARAVELCLKHGVELINHATFADERARDALEAAKDRVFVMPTLGITYTTLHEASAWGITPEVATALGMRRELEQGSACMRDLKRRGVRVLPGGD